MAETEHERCQEAPDTDVDSSEFQPRTDGWLESQLQQLYNDLLTVIERDPEQEILGIALPLVDCVIAAARHVLASSQHLLSRALVELISPATVQAGTPIRALDAWLVIGQLRAALATPQPSTSEAERRP